MNDRPLQLQWLRDPNRTPDYQKLHSRWFHSPSVCGWGILPNHRACILPNHRLGLGVFCNLSVLQVPAVLHDVAVPAGSDLTDPSGSQGGSPRTSLQQFMSSPGLFSLGKFQGVIPVPFFNQPSFFSETGSVLIWVLAGFPKTRIPGKNGEGTPRSVAFGAYRPCRFKVQVSPGEDAGRVRISQNVQDAR